MVIEKQLFEDPNTAFSETVQTNHRNQDFIPNGSFNLSTKNVPGAQRAKQIARRELYVEHKTMTDGLKTIESVCTAMRLAETGHITVCSKQIYRDVVEAKGSSCFKGKHLIACALACVFGACRVERVPRPMSAIVDAGPGGVTEKDVDKVFRKICLLLRRKEYASALTRTDCDMISIFMQHAGIGVRSHPAVTKRARAISSIVKDKSILESKAPEVLCGSIVALALQEARVVFDIDAVAKACSVSVNVINNTVRDLTSAIPTTD